MNHSWANREILNKNEIAKLEKDGLIILDELNKLSDMDYSDISWDDIERLKWAGIYTQRPKNGLFLIRVKLPSGKLNSEQARVIAELSEEYGQSEIQLTIRQCVQIHNLTLKAIPNVIERLSSVGLTSVGGCGDVPRNILGNPIMGIDTEELFDTTEIVEEAAEHLVGNTEYSNLPRKFKISISANHRDTGFAQINDLAFVPAVLRKNGEKINGFHVYVGGGLSAEPHLAKKLTIFVKPEETLNIIRGVALIFREYGYREKRNHCRLKYLVEDWGVSRFEEKLEKYVGNLTHGGREYSRKWNYGRFHGVHRQKQTHFYYFGANVPAGAMTADDLKQFSNIADKYGIMNP